MACGTGQPSSGPVPAVSAPGSILVSSPEFTDGGPIPAPFTCDGQGLPPRIAWQEPSDAAEFVLVVTDPDAPGGTFVHWVLYGMGPNSDTAGEGQAPSGSLEGTNDAGSLGYAAPCPPSGDAPHRYVFSVYALSRPVTGRLPRGATARQVLGAASCCVQAMGTITGTYGRA